VLEGLAIFSATVLGKTATRFFWRAVRLWRGRLGLFAFPDAIAIKELRLHSVRMGWHNGGTAHWAAASNPP
jgi:hypothetical protein